MKEKQSTSRSPKPNSVADDAKTGAQNHVIGGGTAVIRGKKPTFVPKMADGDDGIITDPLGSWTGVPTDSPYDLPIQDADDL